MISRRIFLHAGAVLGRRPCIRFAAALAAKAPGVTDIEIKIGQTMPYSGPASAYGVIGKAELAYFKMVNEGGGVNGRLINLISLDDGYSPPRTVEQICRLVEQDQVALLFHTLGHPIQHRDKRPISTRTRCRNCSSPRKPASSTIPSISPGRWAGSPTTDRSGIYAT